MELATHALNRIQADPHTWNPTEISLFCLAAILGISVFPDILISLFPTKPAIPVKGTYLEKFGLTDHLFININRIITGPYTYHVYLYSWSSHIPWATSQLTLFNTICAFVLLFVVYDFFYYIFHRSLHHRALYPWIHKHHHRQCVPSRGTVDAINTHPFEYTVGAYVHLLAIALVPAHAYTILVFFLLSGLMAPINHTRKDVRLPFYSLFAFAVKDHDLHHHLVTVNYGQYVMVWDLLFGSFRHSDKAAEKSK